MKAGTRVSAFVMMNGGEAGVLWDQCGQGYRKEGMVGVVGMNFLDELAE